tara:strand:- start:221 stop:466 length:246 start_codon:yes stop_codon:yes gene_type:complete
MIDATVYILKDRCIEERTATFDCKAKDFENYLTSIYGKGNMDSIEWDIWEPPEEEGLEEIELDPETEVGKYLKRKMKRKRS